MNDATMPDKDRHAELCRLIQSLYDEHITPTERRRLEDWLCRDKEARRIYAQYMNLFATLYWEKSRFPEMETEETASRTAARPPRSPVLGFLGDCFQQGASFFYRSNIFTLLVAVGLPGLVIAVFAIGLASRSPQPIVATITQTHNCAGHVNDEKIVSPLSPGMGLAQGHRVTLLEGFVEIRFADGARTILEAPTTLEIRDRRSGFLQDGHLTASVPPRATGFTIETPLMKVVDHGTEFGVWVQRDHKTAEVHVFSGEVELDARGEDRPASSFWRLTTGLAARVETSGSRRDVVVRECSPSETRFVRSLPEADATGGPAAPPKTAESATPEILADFSGGNGVMSADQFPGTAGAGWATGWKYRQLEGVKLAVSVERDKPLFDGGAYLRVLTERESGDAHIANAIQRQLELTDRVDITKPHVVSFDVRIDRLGAFDKRKDRFIICSSSDPTAMATVEPTSGWHIRVAGEDHGGIKARHWGFVSGDRAGREVRVDSRIPATEGTPYSFRIAVDPEARRWTPSLSVDGGPRTTFKPMGMRMAGKARDCGYWPVLYLWCMLDGVDNGDEREMIEFSIDSIRIVPAEETAKN